MPYRETIVSVAEMNPPKNKDLSRGTVIGVSTSKQITIRLRVRPLPVSVTTFLEKNAGAIRRLYSERKAEEQGKRDLSADSENLYEQQEDDDEIPATDSGILSILDFREKLRSAFAEDKGQEHVWVDVVEKIAAFGPRRTGPNLLIDITQDGTCQRLWV